MLGHEGTCECCKKTIYALNFDIFYRDNAVTITYKDYKISVYLCLECKKNLALFILGDKK